MSISPTQQQEIREYAFVMAGGRLKSVRDTIQASGGELSPEQWVYQVFENAANAANTATDALEVLYGHKPSHGESNFETVIRMTARLLEATKSDVESIGGVEFLKRIGAMIKTRNKSLHYASVVATYGSREAAMPVLADAEEYVAWVQESLTTAYGITAA